MAPGRHAAAFLALTLLLPFSGATGATVNDAAHDEAVMVGPVVLPADACDASAADIVSYSVSTDAGDLVASLRVRDLHGVLLCGGQSLGAATQAGSSIALEAPVGQPAIGVVAIEFRVLVEPLARVTACTTIILVNGSSQNCGFRAFGDVYLADSEWTLRTPLAGSVTKGNTTLSYDLSGDSFVSRAHAGATYGATVAGRFNGPIRAQDLAVGGNHTL